MIKPAYSKASAFLDSHPAHTATVICKCPPQLGGLQPLIAKMTGADGDQAAADTKPEELPQAADVPKEAEPAEAAGEGADADAEAKDDEGDAAADDKADAGARRAACWQSNM